MKLATFIVIVGILLVVGSIIPKDMNITVLLKIIGAIFIVFGIKKIIKEAYKS